jgi:hypothetical protein
VGLKPDKIKLSLAKPIVAHHSLVEECSGVDGTKKRMIQRADWRRNSLISSVMAGIHFIRYWDRYEFAVLRD